MTLRPVASNVFSMQGEAQPTVEGTQLGLEQGPVRKTPPLLIETTQISLSDPVPCYHSKTRGERLRQTICDRYGQFPQKLENHSSDIMILHDVFNFKCMAVIKRVLKLLKLHITVENAALREICSLSKSNLKCPQTFCFVFFGKYEHLYDTLRIYIYEGRSKRPAVPLRS